MVILTPATGSQTFTCIPRFEPAGNFTLKLRSASKNKQTHSITVTGAVSNGVMTIATTFNPVLTSNEFYFLELIQSTNLVYRSLVFVTTQTAFDKFTTQSGLFTENTTNDNELIYV